MAICNLFNKLDKPSGNFMLFSQYVEDITKNYTEGENWRIVPSRFVAMNINYKGIKESLVSPNGEDLNISIPKYFQNCFENACAYGREHYSEYAANLASDARYQSWNAEISRNLFWNCMFDGKFLNLSDYGAVKVIDEVKYWSDIALQSYDEHQGMGYGEIYCYIPTDAGRMKCQCIPVSDIVGDDGRRADISNKNAVYLEGYNGDPEKIVGDYIQEYYYDRDFSMTFDDDTMGKLVNAADSYYDINTIVILYDILKLVNDKWEKVHSYIPMGMYIAGRFDETENLTNTVRKYVSTSCGTGTSYGLRLCTRFTVSSKGMILKETDPTNLTVDSDNYTAIGQLMTSMSECMSKLLDISKNSNDTTQQFKETMAAIRNNRTNVPYVKDINGTDWWFVNGKAITPVSGDSEGGCMRLSEEVIQKRLDNLMDNDPNNDWSYIDDPNGCNCMVENNHDVVDYINKLEGTDILDKNDFPAYGGGSTGDSEGSVPGPGNVNYATDADVSEALWD